MQLKKLTCLGIFLCFSVCIVTTNQYSLVQASGNIKDTISSDVTWTEANSPYSLSAPTTIAAGIIVTVEPGVNISLNGFTLEVNGVLHAVGTDNDPINIDGGYVGRTFFDSSEHTGSISFTSYSPYWNETRCGSIMENVRLTSTHVSMNCSMMFSKNIIVGYGGLAILSGSPQVINNTLVGASIWAEGGSPLIAKNVIQQPSVGVFIYQGKPQIIDNIFYQGFQGIFINGLADILIQGNIIANFSQGIVGGTYGKLVIEDNLIMYNSLGVYNAYSSLGTIIKHNTLAFNAVAIKFTTNSNATINYNNFEGNNRSFSLESNQNIDAVNNWWGTTDSELISESIYDGNDYYNLGTVNFTPFLETPDSRAPLTTLFSLNTPLPATYPIPTQKPVHTEPSETPTIESTTDISPTNPAATNTQAAINAIGQNQLTIIVPVLLGIIAALIAVLVVVLRSQSRIKLK